MRQVDDDCERSIIHFDIPALTPGLHWVWVLCYDRRSVGQSVLVQSTHPGLTTRFLFPYGIRNTSDSYVLDSVGRPLWWEDGSVFYMCRWPLPAQSFSGPSPLGLATIFYSLRVDTSLFVASYDSQGHGGGIRPRLHTCFHWLHLWLLNTLSIERPKCQDNPSTRTTQKSQPLYCHGIVCLPSRCIAMFTARTTQKSDCVISSHRLHRSDCCLATSNNIRNFIVACVYLVVRCLPVRYLAALQPSTLQYYIALSRVMVKIDGVGIGWLDLLHLYTQFVTTSNTALLLTHARTHTHKVLSL
jgi:hypothetical protein